MKKMVEMESVALHWIRKLDLLSSFFPMRLSRDGKAGSRQHHEWLSLLLGLFFHMHEHITQTVHFQFMIFLRSAVHLLSLSKSGERRRMWER